MFELQQGIKSPRDGSVNWQTYEVYETRAEAVKVGRNYTGLWRVVESKVVWASAAAKVEVV